MTEPDQTSKLENNVSLYRWYAVFYNAYFWMPVFFLYFSSLVSLSEVLQLEAIYYISVVCLEVPSGYFSDRFGRLRTLMLSALSLLAAHAMFFAADGFQVLLAAQVLLAGGIAFNSGTDTAFHFDSLKALDRSEEYKEREAQIAHLGMWATAIAGLVGGVSASYQLNYAYLFSGAAAGASLLLLIQCTEPRSPKSTSGENFGTQIRETMRHLGDPYLSWLFAAALLMVIINHVPYEFYQPYLDLLGNDRPFEASTPTMTGLHMAAAGIIGGLFARHSADIDTYLGTRSTLLAAALLQIAIIASMGFTLSNVVVLIILLRGIPSGLTKAPLNAAISPRVSDEQRATFFSILSLTGRLGFSGLLYVLSLIAGDTTNWDSLSRLLFTCSGISICALIVLTIFAGRIRETPPNRDTTG